MAGRYRLGPLLGRGGSGEVYQAWDERLGREVAVKLLRPDLAQSPEQAERFRREIRTAARLVHPHVVVVLDGGEDAGRLYCVMERLSGRTLSHVLAEGPMAPAEVRRLLAQVLSALGAAHRSGTVHRDVKPGNVLDAGPGHWKVGDFGIATGLAPADESLTVTGLVVGTPGFLAPERLAGSPGTVASDLYAVGALGRAALAGRTPGPSEGAPATVPAAGRAGAAPGPPGSGDPTLDAVLERALAHDPGARFASARAMAAALEAPPAEIRSGAPTVVVAPTALLAPARPRPTLPAVLADLPPWARRRRRALGVVGAGLVLALLGALASSALAPGTDRGPAPAAAVTGGAHRATTTTSTSTSTTTSTTTTTTLPPTTSTTAPAPPPKHGPGPGPAGHGPPGPGPGGPGDQGD